MEPTIITKPAFTAVGMKYRGKNATKMEIPQLWEAFIPRKDEIKHLSTPQISYGVMDNYDPATGDFDYLAGFGVDRAEDVPQGMMRWDVPEQRYAVFACNLRTIHQVFDFIYSQWLPQSSYQRAEGPEFELYDEHYCDDDSPLYIYIPIQ
ncbi:MAG: AraC family transcriptional regulator [Anaerolineae bacterium]|nr:AraC family transcriptional regulator [Anaerolineae bacterium]